eukprot:gnl/MRDRNA2_/MRDRNA2_184111_c0_seq1.p1 gnl/MRDRNA2_/MRDRNA2_184111_c0~~gnl/MRDRNA2_/MRDRNA2_184111_c0_seq1.p1  ORF type:complete len:333 (+),score=80.14 gnl/MRDRNA2_/MRDRNA2_184111_c0_seq1:69-1001(+)
MRASQIPREDLWITSKIIMGFGNHKVDQDHAGRPMTKAKSAKDAKKQLNAALKDLELDYLDLMLMHSPATSVETNVEIWQVLIEAKEQGKVKNIGVSNHQVHDIKALEAATGVLPSVNQISFHPWMPEPWPSVVKWCQSHDIVITAFNSIKGAAGMEKEVAKQAAKTSLSPSQWLLQWALKRDVVVIPGATSEEHIQSNLMLNIRKDEDVQSSPTKWSRVAQLAEDAAKGIQRQQTQESGKGARKQPKEGKGGPEQLMCRDYCSSTGCSWTKEWSCPWAVSSGSEGRAGNDGTLGYKCCCEVRACLKDEL